MTPKQPEALRLADEIEAMFGSTEIDERTAAELRRLQAENERLKTLPMKYRRMEFNAQLQTENDRLRAQRDELLKVLELASEWVEAYISQMRSYTISEKASEDLDIIYTVLAKVEGEKT